MLGVMDVLALSFFCFAPLFALWIENVHNQIALTKLECGFDRVCQPGAKIFCFFMVIMFADHQTVHHSFDEMDFIAIHLYLFIQAVDGAVHAGAQKTRFLDFVQSSLISALTAAHNWRQD